MSGQDPVFPNMDETFLRVLLRLLVLFLLLCLFIIFNSVSVIRLFFLIIVCLQRTNTSTVNGTELSTRKEKKKGNETDELNILKRHYDFFFNF